MSRIVGDNIDLTIQRRYQTLDKTNQSIHWTQQYAILDRVNDPSLDNTKSQKPVESLQLVDLLPDKDVQSMFKRDCAVLVSRVVCKYLSAFKHMKDVVTFHIGHIYSEEMAKKSETVSVANTIIRYIIFCKMSLIKEHLIDLGVIQYPLVDHLQNIHVGMLNGILIHIHLIQL